MDLKPLLEILTKVSQGRILAVHEMAAEGELKIAKIPVKLLNPSDKTDVALRRFAADWLRQNVKDVAVDTRFEKVQGISWYDEAKQETPLVGMLVLTWWHKPPMTEYEMLLASQRARRREAEKS